MFLSTDGQYLRIISSSENDTGSYMCLAKNDIAHIQKMFSIEVYGICFIVFLIYFFNLFPF